MQEKRITGYHNLEVYQTTYQAMLQVFREILSKLPAAERFDLRDQIFRAAKAVPRLIAEGYAKKHQQR